MTRDPLDAVLEGWASIDAAFAEVRERPWGAVVADERFPRLLECNYARVTAREPVALDEVERDLRAAAPTAPRLHAMLFHPDDQPDLIAAASTAGADLFFDRVLVAGPRPDADADPERVEELPAADPGFRAAYRRTSELFGIRDPATLDELVEAEERVLAPHGKRWFVVRGDDGAVEAIAALLPGPAAEIDHVATVPAARRRGHARALVARCVAEARAAGTDDVFLLAEPDGPAERLYRRVGFRPIATFAGWTRGAGPAPLDAEVPRGRAEGYAPGAGQGGTT